MADIAWRDQPEEHDYDDAGVYMSMLYSPGLVKKIDEALREAPLVHRKAKDILFASEKPVLPADNQRVRKFIKRIKKGRPISPILLLVTPNDDPHVIIADGHHRTAAVYHTQEDAPIPVKLASWPGDQVE